MVARIGVHLRAPAGLQRESDLDQVDTASRHLFLGVLVQRGRSCDSCAGCHNHNKKRFSLQTSFRNAARKKPSVSNVCGQTWDSGTVHGPRPWRASCQKSFEVSRSHVISGHSSRTLASCRCRLPARIRQTYQFSGKGIRHIKNPRHANFNK